MSREGLGEARLRLNPAHLGPVEVRLSIQHDQASIQFAAHHGQVREAIETALPRLREMLAQEGIQLQNASVSDQQPRGGFAGGQGGGERTGAGPFPGTAAGLSEEAVSTENDPLPSVATSLVVMTPGGVDFFA